MPCAFHSHFIRPDLATWQAYAAEVKCDLTSAARIIGGELIFIDPIPLAEDALTALVASGKPAAIILTNSNHARAAADFRARFQIPILAHAEAAPELEVKADTLLADGELAPGGLEVVPIPGAPAGEIALCGGEVIHLGDALIHLESHGFTLLPEKYCRDPHEMRRALGKLLRFNFEVLTFAHGLPLVSQARQRLENLLA